MKYFIANLTKQVQNLYVKKQKTLTGEIKDLYIKWRDIACSWIGALNIIKTSIFSNWYTG